MESNIVQMPELINCHWCGKQHDKLITCGSILIDTQELLDLRKCVKELEEELGELCGVMKRLAQNIIWECNDSEYVAKNGERK